MAVFDGRNLVMSPRQYLMFKDWLTNKGLDIDTIPNIVEKYNEFANEMRIRKDSNEKP